MGGRGVNTTCKFGPAVIVRRTVPSWHCSRLLFGARSLLGALLLGRPCDSRAQVRERVVGDREQLPFHVGHSPVPRRGLRLGHGRLPLGDGRVEGHLGLAPVVDDDAENVPRTVRLFRLRIEVPIDRLCGYRLIPGRAVCVA